MTEHEQETEQEHDPLLEEQAGKGYGEDEGERDGALEQEDVQSL